MSIIYFIMHYVGSYAPGLPYDKLILLFLMDLDIIAYCEIRRWMRLNGGRFLG